MTDKLTYFLTRHRACRDGLERLAATGAATPDEAWERADARDLVWAVTRPGVMSKMQRRKFLSEAVLAPIEHLLTDERSLIILRKLRTNECVTQEDKDASRAASQAAYAAASWAAAWAAEAEDAAASSAASWAAASASSAEAAAAWAYAADAAASSAEEAASASSAEAAADSAEREAQAKWIRENIKLSDLHIN